jgi:hypothetical protein
MERDGRGREEEEMRILKWREAANCKILRITIENSRKFVKIAKKKISE